MGNINIIYYYHYLYMIIINTIIIIDCYLFVMASPLVSLVFLIMSIISGWEGRKVYESIEQTSMK